MTGELTVACYNSPGTTATLSGDTAKIEALKRALEQNSVFVRKL